MDVEQWQEAGKNADGSTNKFKYAWKDMPQKGHIGLQDHGGKVWFRNIKIQQFWNLLDQISVISIINYMEAGFGTVRPRRTSESTVTNLKGG